MLYFRVSVLERLLEVCRPDLLEQRSKPGRRHLACDVDPSKREDAHGVWYTRIQSFMTKRGFRLHNSGYLVM